MSEWLAWMAEHWVIASIFCFSVLLVLVAIADILQTKHTIRHNFPVVGNLRYLLEEIGPELRQYWVANDKEESPFNRSERRWVYATSKGENSNFGFGTTELLYGVGYSIIKHKAFPFPDSKAVYIDGDDSAVPSLKVMGASHKRRRPFRPKSIVNISAMSFGSLGERAVAALNKGAKMAGAFHNTGEGGISPYHAHGADLMWQLGTGYFGARDAEGRFSLDVLAAKIEKFPTVRAIEVKLSQGAKPGKGGILPGKKVTAEIAEIRGIPLGKDCYSPNAHSQFDTVDELIDFVETIADRTGLPVGIKSAVGEADFWVTLAERMKTRNEGPDFIAIDGGEGGTGAAPLTFSDHVSLPFKIGFQRVYRIFQEKGVSQDVVWIGAGKLGFPDRAIVAIAMGCDLIYIAREAMLAIGCIQAQQCHTDHCPAGVATQNRWLQAGLDVTDKSERCDKFLRGFRKELLALAHAAGYEHPGQFIGTDVEFSTGINEFTSLEDVMGYRRDPVNFTGMLDYQGD